MDVRWGAGYPLLLAALLLTGVHCKAESSTVRSESTQDTSIAPAHVSTEPSVSNGVTNAVTPPGTLPTSEEPKTKTTTGILETNSISKTDSDNATTISLVPTIKTNDSSDSNQVAVTSTNTTRVSANPNPISINTTSESSMNNSSEHTSDPTQSGPTQSSPTQSDPTQSSPTQSSPTQSDPTQSGPTQSSPTQSSPTQSSPTQPSPTQSSTETTIKVNETGTGSTDQKGNTTSTTITASPSSPLSQESTQSSHTNSSPTGGSEAKTVSTAPAVAPRDTSTNDATTEHNVELPRVLSPGSVAAITIIVILLVLVIFGGAAYWKIRHSSYGRLLEDQDYGSLGNYNNPLYDDS